MNSDTDGVFYFRIFPNLLINEPDIHVDLRFLNDWTLQLLNPNFLQNYQIIIYNKSIPFVNKETEDNFYNLCTSLGIKIIYDIDDNYILESSHPNYKKWKDSNAKETVENSIKRAAYVTTTTELFAERLRLVNKNVAVIPNAINPSEKQWVSNKPPSDKIRFLWGGGISHIVDLRLLRDEFKKLDKKFLEETKMIMCGYDLRMKMNDGSIMKDDDARSQWKHFEDIFTNNGIYIKSHVYQKYLLSSNNMDNDTNYGRNTEFINEFYQRRHTKPIFLFGTMYNEADITIAPLKSDNMFNYCKSQLKLIESGVHHCPIIMSNYGPYTIDDIEGKRDGIQKGWLVDEKGGNDWYAKMKWYTMNKSAIREHGEACYEYVMSKYSMDVVMKDRLALYREVASM